MPTIDDALMLFRKADPLDRPALIAAVRSLRGLSASQLRQQRE